MFLSFVWLYAQRYSRQHAFPTYYAEEAARGSVRSACNLAVVGGPVESGSAHLEVPQCPACARIINARVRDWGVEVS